jgi:branched-chain amino acid transport system substrate-binding protein
MNKTIWRLVALVLALALVAAACGSDDDDSSSDDGGDDAAATEEATEDAASGEFEAVAISIGGVLPESGGLGPLGVPMIESAKLAVEDINAEGGNVTYVFEDSGTDPAISGPAVDRLLAGGSNVIVGAGASGITDSFIQLLSDGEIPQCSPSATSTQFTEQENANFFFRTSPPDNGVAPIISDEVIADGGTRVAIVARNDDYGVGLAGLVAAALDEQGIENETISYDPAESSFDSTIENVTAYGPDKIVNIGFFFDGTAVIRGLVEAGFEPANMYGSDGLFLPSLPGDMGDATLLDGMKVFGASGDEAFNARLSVITDGNLIYGGGSYDCVVLMALAAQITGDASDGAGMIEAVGTLTHDGTECTSYGECAGLIAADEDIDYIGASGEINLSEPGDPTVANYAVAQWQEGVLTVLTVAPVDLTEVS